MTLIKEPKKWYIKLFTLGKNFSSRTFSDNSKKFLLNAVGLFVVVTFTFYVESVGDDFENRQKYLDVSKEILSELYAHQDYVDYYIEQIDFVSEMYQKQYDRWEVDNDSIFLDFMEDEEEPDGKYYYAPMGIYTQRQPFDPPRRNFTSFSKGNQDFFLINPEISNRIFELYDGTELKYLIENTGKNEERYVNQFVNRIANKWIYDLPWVDVDYNEFWIENRKYIQNDKFIKYNLYKRIDLWEYGVKEQLSMYSKTVLDDIKSLDSVIQQMDNEKYFLYWKID
jgi:hypothetical protein